MDDYISRQAAIDVLATMQGLCTSKTALVQNSKIWQQIKDLPSADVQPVRHGHWDTVEDWDGDEHYQCSECGAEFVLIDGTPEDNDYLYCPHCGALMDEVT